MALKKQDKIIWDSNFGYEVGYYLGKGVLENTYLVDLVTGIAKGHVSHTITEVIPFTPRNVEKMEKRYGYKKEFPIAS